MRANVWHGHGDVRVEEVPDPRIQAPTDAIVRVTSTAICGSDLHLYDVFGMFMTEGDILGHEPMGVVEAIGSAVTNLKVGDRVVVPFNIACGSCFMCDRQLYAQCETTQNHEHGTGASLFGYTKLYGSVPGGQAELLRVPHADFGPIVVPEGAADERFLYLSDVLPTAWQAVRYADTHPGGVLAVLGLGPIGQMCVRVAPLLGVERVIGIDLVPDRLKMAEKAGAEVVDWNQTSDLGAKLREMTLGRGPDSVIDAVGTEAHGAVLGKAAQKMAGLLPDAVAAPFAKKMGVDRMSALLAGIDVVRRGGTVSIVGVYVGARDPMPMFQLFDKGVQLRMGQAHVKRWVPEILPYLTADDDVLGTETFATHRLPLADAPAAYEMFKHKRDACVKVVLKP